MSETLTIRVPEPLRRFIDKRAGDNGLYENASEYLRDLIRRDFEKEETRKWHKLSQELQSALDMDEKHYIPFDAQAIIDQAQSIHAKEKS